MKDYELMASKAGLSIYRSMYDEQGIKKYKINRKSNHVEITYMNGATTYNELTETSKEDLDEKQTLTFEKMCGCLKMSFLQTPSATSLKLKTPFSSSI